MRRSAALLPAVVFALVAGAAEFNPAAAQIYKWVDDQGRVNYSNGPPPENKKPGEVKIVDEQRPNVSTYDAAPKQDPAGEVAALRDKVDRLQREIDSVRQSASPPPTLSDPAFSAAAYERCIAERRVDCVNGPASVALREPEVILVAPRAHYPTLLPVPISPAKKKPAASASKIRANNRAGNSVTATD